MAMPPLPSHSAPQSPSAFGHPPGLFMLFFAEMWERFSYYGMRALLVFYMAKGFLKYNDGKSYAVYGAYTALVYMTPFFGGMLADRILGARRAVILGGLLMAAGHLLMGRENHLAFFTALGLLIVGNGFFKPNISTMVGALYPPRSPRRDAGFTIFYMGINLGAAMSPLLCGYIGETYNWHYGFGLATIGMLVGVAIFIVPSMIATLLVMAAAIAAFIGLLWFRPDDPYSIAINVFVGLALLAASLVQFVASRHGGLPSEVGAPPDREHLRKYGWMVYVGTAVSIPVLMLFVSGFSPLSKDNEPLSLVSAETIQKLRDSDNNFSQIAAVVVEETSKPAGLVLFISGVLAFGYLFIETFRLERIARDRMLVVLILTFFSMLFWAFFEQAGSSINNFTDRNVDRVWETSRVVAADVGKTIELQPTQAQLGFYNGDQLFTLTTLTRLRETEGRNNPGFTIPWQVVESNVGMGIAPRSGEMPASVFQSVNPVYILLFGLVFTGLWSFLGARGLEPSTPFKFSLGLLQLGLGFAALWYGAQQADARGMVALSWLLLGYLLQTTGELCLSPVGLSMVTKLSPARLVSTVMGTWFLATAFSQFLAAIIAQFTRVGGHEGDEETLIPPPIETVHVYGDVFGKIAIAACIAAVICFLLVPMLKRMMHEDVIDEAG